MIATTKHSSYAFLTPQHLGQLAEISRRQKVKLPLLLALDVAIQMCPQQPIEEAVVLSGLSNADAELSCDAFYMEGWIKDGSTLFGPPSEIFSETLPLAKDADNIDPIIDGWVRLWEVKTGQALSAPEVRDAVSRRIYQQKSFPLPAVDGQVIDLFLRLRGGATFDSFLYDVSCFLPDMLFAIAVNVIKLYSDDRHKARVEEVQTQWVSLMPGRTVVNIYLFHALAASGVIAPDVLRALPTSPTPSLLIEGALRESRLRLSSGTQGLVNIDNLLRLSDEH